jgi:hypothetical protein
MSRKRRSEDGSQNKLLNTLVIGNEDLLSHRKLG